MRSYGGISFISLFNNLCFVNDKFNIVMLSVVGPLVGPDATSERVTPTTESPHVQNLMFHLHCK